METRQRAASLLYGYPDLMDTAKRPLKDAAAVNSVRWALYSTLGALGIPLEAGTGGRTKFNRTRLGMAKSHWADAACVGASTPDALDARIGQVLVITAKGHGTRQMCRTNKYGFPIRHMPRQKVQFGLRTGDLVKAVVPKGKYAGTHVGRITIRSRPSFKLNGFDVHPKYLTRVQRSDGYAYTMRKEGAASPAS